MYLYACTYRHTHYSPQSKSKDDKHSTLYNLLEVWYIYVRYDKDIFKEY